jgi:hypothetical protein
MKLLRQALPAFPQLADGNKKEGAVEPLNM